MAKNKGLRDDVIGTRRFEKENPDDFLKKTPIWSFKLMDKDHPKWSLKVQKNLYEDIILKLKDYEGLTWAEIMQASGGRSHGTNNHYEPIDELCKEARDRIVNLGIYTDSVFSLRCGGKKRLYGTFDSGVFFIIWFDSEHEIYPVKK